MSEMRKRTERRDPGRARVTAADLPLLSFAARVGLFNTRHAQLVMGRSLAMTRRRLRVLRDLGLVRVFVENMESCSWYGLTDAAVPLLERTCSLDAEKVRRPRGIGNGSHLHHHAGLVTFRAQMQLACLRTGIRLVDFRMEADLRRELGVQRRDVLVPDGLAVLEREGQRVAIAVEIDTGSINAGWMGQKFADYAQQRHQRVPVAHTDEWCVAVIVLAGTRRLNRLVLAAAEVGVPTGLVHFALAAKLSDHDVLAPVWVSPRLQGDEQVSLATTGLLSGVITDGDRRDHRFGGPDAAAGADRGRGAAPRSLSEDEE